MRGVDLQLMRAERSAKRGTPVVTISVAALSISAALTASFCWWLNTQQPRARLDFIPGYWALGGAGEKLVLHGQYKMSLSNWVLFVAVSCTLAVVAGFLFVRHKNLNLLAVRVLGALWLLAIIVPALYSSRLPDGVFLCEMPGVCSGLHQGRIEYLAWPYLSLGAQVAAAAVYVLVITVPRIRQRRSQLLAALAIGALALGGLLAAAGLEHRMA